MVKTKQTNNKKTAVPLFTTPASLQLILQQKQTFAGQKESRFWSLWLISSFILTVQGVNFHTYIFSCITECEAAWSDIWLSIYNQYIATFSDIVVPLDLH